jgi:hypothetical protein
MVLSSFGKKVAFGFGSFGLACFIIFILKF